MSDHNEAPSTEDEIEDVISEAKKAAKAQNPNKSGKSKKNRNRNRNRNKTKAQDEESSENLFDEIDSVADADDDDENISPKMKSAKEFSNAFAAAKVKREKDLKTKRAEQEVSDEEDEEEDLIFEPDDGEEYDDDSAEFEVDSEDEEYEDDEDDEEYDGIFETDDENEEYIENVDVDDDDEEDFDDDDDEDYDDEDDDDDYDDDDDDDDDEDDDDEDDDEEDDEDEEGTFSTKAKFIIGIIIAILVLAIIGAGIFFLNRGGDQPKKDNTTSQVSDGSVTGIQFKEPSVSLRVGETIPLEIIVEPDSAKDKVLKLKSNDPTIAKVDETGKLTGVASGSTTVTATLKSNETITASLIVNVIDDDQDAINIYNKFVNSIIDGSTDIDSDVEPEEEEQDEQQYDEFGNPIESSDTDSDSDTPKTTVVKDTLTGNIIKDLDNDGNLELALLYKDAHDSSIVRIFRLADPNEVEEETTEEEQEYDEFGNPIEKEDTDSETETDTEKNADENSDERVLTEVAEGTELYTTCYEKIETEGASWNTSYVEIKEDESEQAKVTILSSGYNAPTYTYESEDSKVATVDAQGNIKAVKPGTTYVIVTSPLNSDAMAKIKVRVKDDTDLLDDYLAKINKVEQTNDSVFPTKTLTGKAIVDVDNDGVSELLLRFDYSDNVQAVEMVKVENEKCVVYKTYNNLSDLYEYVDGDSSYKNTILVHYTTGKVCMEYRAVVAKSDSRTNTSEQKILSVESGGNLSELVNFKTTTDITTKTVSSEVVVEDEDTTPSYEEESSAPEDDDTSSVWYDDEDTDSEDIDDTTSSEDEDDNNYYDDNDYDYSYLNNSLGKLTFKKLSEFDDDDDNNDDDDTSSAASSSTTNNNDEPSSRVTSTVTSEVSEETTKYFVNGTPVEQSVYEETLSTYSARYSVWSAWETV